MVGRARVCHPSQRLGQRAIGMRCLPTTHQSGFVGQAVEQVAFAGHARPKQLAKVTENPDCGIWPNVLNGYLLNFLASDVLS